MKNVLSIAGSDPSGGAGIQVDLKTFTRIGVDGMAVITALTAQNPYEVRGVVAVPPAFVRDQIAAIFDEMEVAAVKIGMLANAEIASVVADALERYAPEHIVLDPVMVASSGDSLIDGEAVEVLKARLIPLASVITPNIPEAMILAGHTSLRGSEADAAIQKSLDCFADARNDDLAQDVLKLGARAVLLKGGHLKGDVMRDVLVHAGGVRIYEAKRVDVENAHGTGCRLSSALASYLALGEDLESACGKAKEYLTGDLKVKGYVISAKAGIL